MSMNDLPQGEKYIRNHRFHKRWHKVLMALGAVVVFCTTYALILPASTMEISCNIPEHTHTDACYTKVSSVQKMIPICTPKTLNVHQHTSDCYGADGEVNCGYADFVVHTHDAECYDENGELWCPLREIATHAHTDACYAQAGGKLICGHDETDGSTGHTHGEDCYGEGGNLQCPLPESEAVEEHHHTDDCYAEGRGELACGKTEIILHRHVAACYDETGSLICGKMQVLQHQHSDACFQKTEVSADIDRLTCTNTDEHHVHTDRCYGTWVLSCGLEEHTHTDTCYTAADDTPADAAEDEPALYDAAGKLNVSLLYGDQKPQSDYPDGVSYSTHTNMTGYLKLEPIGAKTDLTNVTVKLTIPRKYVEKDSVSIPQFNTNSSSTEYEIPPVTEDDDNYYACIHFTTYDKTQTLVLPFVLSFLDDVVPDILAGVGKLTFQIVAVDAQRHREVRACAALHFLDQLGRKAKPVFNRTAPFVIAVIEHRVERAGAEHDVGVCVVDRNAVEACPAGTLCRNAAVADDLSNLFVRHQVAFSIGGGGGAVSHFVVGVFFEVVVQIREIVALHEAEQTQLNGAFRAVGVNGVRDPFPGFDVLFLRETDAHAAGVFHAGVGGDGVDDADLDIAYAGRCQLAVVFDGQLVRRAVRFRRMCAVGTDADAVFEFQRSDFQGLKDRHIFSRCIFHALTFLSQTRSEVSLISSMTRSRTGVAMPSSLTMESEACRSLLMNFGYISRSFSGSLPSGVEARCLTML